MVPERPGGEINISHVDESSFRARMLPRNPGINIKSRTELRFFGSPDTRAGGSRKILFNPHWPYTLVAIL